MSFRDAPPEKGALQSDAFLGYYLPIILFGGLAFFVWSLAQFLWRKAEEGAKTVSTIAAPAKPVPAGPKTGGTVPVDSRAIQGLVNEQVTGHFDPSGDAPPVKRKVSGDDEGLGTISIMPDKGARDKIVREWKMRGVIYDLVTLLPVPDVDMIFTDNATNSRAQIRTDSLGRYRAVLPALTGSGYLVSLSKAGYAKTYLDPGTEGVAEMTVARRKELVQELSSQIMPPASLQPNSDTPLVTDFHMAPK